MASTTMLSIYLALIEMGASILEMGFAIALIEGLELFSISDTRPPVCLFVFWL